MPTIISPTWRGVDDELDALLASDPRAMRDPFGLYARLRSTDPIHGHGRFVLLTRYADVQRLLQDTSSRYTKRYDRSAHLAAFIAGLDAEDRGAVDEYYGFMNLQMQRADLDAHARLRRIAHRAFTPRRVAALRKSVERYAEDLIAPLAEAGGGDITEFAYELPLMVIVDLLGCPAEDRTRIRDWSAAIGRHLDQDSVVTLRAAVRAIREFGAYVEDVIAGHRGRRDEDDLIAALLQADEEGGLTGEELKAMFVLLLFAGHETTANLLGSGLLALLERPDQWRALCADPTLVHGAVEELLRVVSPVQWVTRVCAEPHEIGGVPVPVGHTVLGIVAAANRDPAVFAAPDELDITRAGRHLAFGFGARFCLGASLARLEGTVAFSMLTRRFAGIELLTEQPAYKSNAVLRRLTHLEVRLSA